jgi:hypothetical protein
LESLDHHAGWSGWKNEVLLEQLADEKSGVEFNISIGLLKNLILGELSRLVCHHPVSNLAAVQR